MTVVPESTAQARLSRALRAARAIVWELDLRTTAFSYDAPLQLFGACALPVPLRLRQVLRLVDPQDRQEVVARARAAIAHRSPYVQHFRSSFVRVGAAPGPPLWVEHHGAVLCDAQGQPYYLVGTMIDITAHKQALDALAVADHRKDDFLATLAHELRNPLTAIGAAAQLLRSVPLKPEQVSSCVDKIHRQCGQLGRLVGDLFDLSHVVRNRLDLKRERTDLREAVKTAIEAVGEPLRRRRHRLNVELPEQRLPLDADPVRISQLLGNLLSNAVKYTPDGGQIELTALRCGEWAVVKVRDSGLGIAAEHLPHVFEPFYQVESSLVHAQGGLGIGLALVRRIAQLHGGSVSVSSGGLGQGCEFTVRLPLLAEEPLQAPAAPSAGLVRAAQPLRVLVADDDADVAETLSMALQMCGHEVQVALDGEEALRLAEEFRPQAALLDVGMPKRAGHDVAREIRGRPWASEIGVLLVALTGWNARELQGKLDMSAFDSQMIKPPDIDAVRRLLERPRERTGRSG